MLDSNYHLTLKTTLKLRFSVKHLHFAIHSIYTMLLLPSIYKVTKSVNH